METKDIVALALTFLTGIGIKQVWPIVKEWFVGLIEVRKIKAKNQHSGHDKIADIWERQYNDCKEELSRLKEKQIQLEVKVATLKERLSRYAKEHGVVLSVKPKNDE